MTQDNLPPGLDPWFSERLAQLVRGDASSFGHLLHSHEQPVVIPGTQTNVRTHFLAFDANGHPAVDLFARSIAASITDFCIPRDRLLKALDAWKSTGSTMALTSLQHQARELFVASETSGEGGELLLFMLLEQTLGIPQLISKMALKTSTSMHVHGSDGIHASLSPEGILDLYWGESKLHESTSSAFSDCFRSIAPFLREDGGSVRQQDLLLVRQNLDLGQRELTAHLIKFFDETEPEALKIRFRGACLVGFDHKNYPNLKKLEATQTKAVNAAVKRWHASVENHIGTQKLAEVHIDLFCIPFPSVSNLRKSINASIGVTK